MAQLLARGPEVWRVIADITPLAAHWTDQFGTVYDLQPFCILGQRIFVTGTGGALVYIEGDGLWEEATGTLLRDTTYLEPYRRGFVSAAWSITAYQVFMVFAIRVVPYGRVVGTAVSAVSVVAYFNRHRAEFDQVFSQTRTLISEMRTVYSSCPRLCGVMLLLALEQTAVDLTDEIRRQGIVHFVVGQMDMEQYAMDVARLAGSLLKGSVGSPPGPASLFSLATVKRIYKICRLIASVRTVLAGPQFRRDPHLRTAEAVRVFSAQGIRVSQGQAQGIISEGCWNRDEIIQKLTAIDRCATELDRVVEALDAAYDGEVFRT